MIKIKRNENYCYVDEGDFPYCGCEPSNKDIMTHRNFNFNGCYYIDKVFSMYNVKRLAKYMNSYEIYDIDNGWDGLEFFNIDNSIKEHFVRSNHYTVVPKFYCKKVKDEFSHVIKLKLDKNMYHGFNFGFNKEKGKVLQGWCVMNTDDENIKLICQCVIWYPKKY